MILYNLIKDDNIKYKATLGLSIATGITSIVLNLVTFGIAGSIFGIISTLGFAANCYYKGKLTKEAKTHSKQNSNANFLYNDSKKATAAGTFAIAAYVTSQILNLFTFGIGGTMLSLLTTAGIGLFCYYKGKIAKSSELSSDQIKTTENNIHFNNNASMTPA
tara:strand:+ start:4596 stop:5081 length:486 start_codon:yes stop_codon:yes gene_type:complete